MAGNWTIPSQEEDHVPEGTRLGANSIQKPCGCIYDKVMVRDVDRPFMSFYVYGWRKTVACAEHPGGTWEG